MAGHVVTRHFRAAGTNLSTSPSSRGRGIRGSQAPRRGISCASSRRCADIADHRLTRLDAGSARRRRSISIRASTTACCRIPRRKRAPLRNDSAGFHGGWRRVVAAFGSDRVARVNAATGGDGARGRARGAGETSRQMRGPRALALVEATQRLYVLNRFPTVSVIGTASGSVARGVPTGATIHFCASIREGRGFLFDARLSGNGTMSCAVCHLDADVDGIAWDPAIPAADGDDAQSLRARPDAAPAHDASDERPDVTQTLRAMIEGAPLPLARRPSTVAASM